VSKLRNSNHLLTELNSAEAALWLQKAAQTIPFEMEVKHAIRVASRDNEIILHFVPITFEPDDLEELRKLESANGLPTCSISKARWAKSKQNRSTTQKVASL
ncbi:hypothetical protein BDP27DRAFT_1145892, partial [Rhodocollybia butyracea]